MKGRSVIVYALVSALLAGLFYFGYFRPRHKILKNLRTERVKIEAEVAKLRIKKKQMDKIESELQTLNATLKDLEEIIPEKKEIADILSQFQQLAYNSRLNITKFTPKGETAREFYSEWPIPIEVTGNYNNLGIFFDKLSRFSRLFTIEKFVIKALPRQTESTTISASFTSKTYIFGEKLPAVTEPPKEAKRK